MKRDQIMIVAALVILGVAGALVWANYAVDREVTDANTRAFVCVDTGKPYFRKLEAGMIEPILSPHSNERTGYAAEACFWTKSDDGNWIAKAEPTYVILKKRLGIEEQTFCPDCGHEVVGHNPPPDQALMDDALARTDRD